jgi:hypothetical protein
MAKDPAVLFYTSDFLSGVIDMDMDERGQYITLLCAQHQKGRLSEKTIRLLVGSVSVSVLAKFKRDENGLYFNERMEFEAIKRAQFTDSRRNNGEKGGRPRKPTQNLVDNHMPNHMENENENDNIIEKDKGGVGEKGKTFFEKSINDELWQESVMRSCKINNPAHWINEFNDHANATQEHYNTIKDWRRHCVNWIKKEILKDNQHDKSNPKDRIDSIREWGERMAAGGGSQ